MRGAQHAGHNDTRITGTDNLTGADGCGHTICTLATHVTYFSTIAYNIFQFQHANTTYTDIDYIGHRYRYHRHAHIAQYTKKLLYVR